MCWNLLLLTVLLKLHGVLWANWQLLITTLPLRFSLLFLKTEFQKLPGALETDSQVVAFGLLGSENPIQHIPESQPRQTLTLPAWSQYTWTCSFHWKLNWKRSPTWLLLEIRKSLQDILAAWLNFFVTQTKEGSSRFFSALQFIICVYLIGTILSKHEKVDQILINVFE